MKLLKKGSTVYTGNLKDYQLYGNNEKRYTEYEAEDYSPEQNFLYKRALFGLSVYSDEELSKMHWDKKKRIMKVHQRTQKILNLWKQEVSNSVFNDIFSKIFWKSKLIQDLISKFGVEGNPHYISRITFNELGINKRQIIEKLMEERILPINFYDL